MTVAATVERATNAFIKVYGVTPEFVAFAPGRVNLIGEHTDYNDGFVLPCAINYGTAIACRARNDTCVHAVADDYAGARDGFDTAQPILHHESAEWATYVRGVFAAYQQRGYGGFGCDIAIAGNVPQGAGLSSSASLSVALARTIKQVRNLDSIGAAEIARIAQQSENDFVGCACGIMDQQVSAEAQPGHALLIDCRTQHGTAIAIPDTWSILVFHSGVVRGLVESAYNERRAQCEAAARHYGVAMLRDIDEAHLIAHRGTLDPLTFRRALHVVSENARTLHAAKALQSSDILSLGQLMAASHASMRDDFEITVPRVDHLVSLLKDVVGDHGGVRMTGGGFGGCVVAVVPRARVDVLHREFTTYAQKSGLSPMLNITVEPEAGARILIPS
jgi:galactokinase